MFYLILSDYVLSDVQKEFIMSNGGFYDEFTGSVIIYSTTSDLVVNFKIEFSIEGGVSNV